MTQEAVDHSGCESCECTAANVGGVEFTSTLLPRRPSIPSRATEQLRFTCHPEHTQSETTRSNHIAPIGGDRLAAHLVAGR